MKEIINKLFEWLGYKVLSQKEYDAMNLTLKDILGLVRNDRNERVMRGISYWVIDGVDGYHVVDGDCYLIRYYPFGNDKEYARLCADELCDMLNQKI